MKKRILSLTLILSMLCAFMPIAANAAEIVNSGTCGDNVTWTLDDNGTLTISGTGDIKNYSYSSHAPWWYSSSSIVKIVIEDGVTRIGSYAIYDCTGLTSVIIPDSVTSIEIVKEGSRNRIKSRFLRQYQTML